jgi:hypothetical protein
VRGLGVGIYTDAGNKPAATPFWAGFFASNKALNKPIQMNTGTSNWVRYILQDRGCRLVVRRSFAPPRRAQSPKGCQVPDLRRFSSPPPLQELPVFAYDMEDAKLTAGSARELNLTAGTKYWLAAQQTRSYTNQQTGVLNPTSTAMPTATAEPYFQVRGSSAALTC